ncbi:uncharacterized protein METZ01_LOCUS212343 [marine metagenome]|uniref:Uncharacterized protein n=1 Tax=marine metagenome TaxID=408172 RepID=A0A382FA10_9ZZZZ|tara:strand:- start:443 stop:772 length:330 start_codon:yes stop_codon:yes gene_type:complete
MPRKLKKSIDKMNKTELRQEAISTMMEARKRRMRMHHERRIAEDLNNVIKKWHDAKLPKEIVVGFSACYLVNFIFDCYEPEEANHLLITAISRQLIHTKDIEDTETTVQ